MGDRISIQYKNGNENITALCDLIEVLQALNQLWPGYVVDSADLDQEGCFV